MTPSDRAELDSARAEFGRATADTSSVSLEQRITRRVDARFKGKTAQQAAAFLNEGFRKYLPNMIFAMLPIFALILYLLYFRSGRFYAEHLIFAFHFHAFVFVAMTLMALAPEAIRQVFTVWVLVYLFLAMRRVYGESRLRTAAKFATTVIVYFIVLLVASLTVMAGVVLAG
jgi:hypothetical protein